MNLKSQFTNLYANYSHATAASLVLHSYELASSYLLSNDNKKKQKRKRPMENRAMSD